MTYELRLCCLVVMMCVELRLRPCDCCERTFWPRVYSLVSIPGARLRAVERLFGDSCNLDIAGNGRIINIYLWLERLLWITSKMLVAMMTMWWKWSDLCRPGPTHLMLDREVRKEKQQQQRGQEAECRPSSAQAPRAATTTSTPSPRSQWSSARSLSSLVRGSGTLKSLYCPCCCSGNGPSGISLSFLLSGHWPHYTGAASDEFLHARLMDESHLSLVEQDLEFLTEVMTCDKYVVCHFYIHSFQISNIFFGLSQASIASTHSENMFFEFQNRGFQRDRDRLLKVKINK